ncbi:MAG: YraN family protein [Candidatus Acidiferrales bacterium]
MLTAESKRETAQEAAQRVIARLMFALVDFAARKGLAEPGGDESPGNRATNDAELPARSPEELFVRVSGGASGSSRQAAGESARSSEQSRRASERASAKHRARRTGVRGETYAYWYLRRHGYTPVARNFTVPGASGEIDIACYDGRMLAFVEVKTRSAEKTSGPSLGTAAGAPASRPPRPSPEDAVTPEKRRVLARMAQHFIRSRGAEGQQYRFDVLAIETRPGQRPVVRLHKGAFTVAEN